MHSAAVGAFGLILTAVGLIIGLIAVHAYNNDNLAIGAALIVSGQVLMAIELFILSLGKKR